MNMPGAACAALLCHYDTGAVGYTRVRKKTRERERESVREKERRGEKGDVKIFCVHTTNSVRVHICTIRNGCVCGYYACVAC